MEFLASYRYLLFALVVVAQVLLIARIWSLPAKHRRSMLLAYLAVAVIQSSSGAWLEAVRSDPNQAYTPVQSAVAYGLLLLRPVDWALCFAVIHECLNAYLTPYRALHLVGQRLFRVGMVATAALIVSSVFFAPSEAMAALAFVYSFEPTLIYGSALALLLAVGLFVSHFELSSSPNDRVIFSALFVIFGVFTLLSSAGHFLNSHAAHAALAGLRVALAAPVLAIAAFQLSVAGEVVPALSSTPARADVRRALESLNTSLERVVKP